jgi:hypothetical protein
MNRFDYSDKDFPAHLIKMLSSLQPNDLLPIDDSQIIWKILSNHQTYFLYEIADQNAQVNEQYIVVETNG